MELLFFDEHYRRTARSTTAILGQRKVTVLEVAVTGGSPAHELTYSSLIPISIFNNND